MTIIRFLKWDCEVERQSYKNGQTALQLYAANSEHNESQDTFPGEPICTATVCLANHEFPEGVTCIKDYSENEGILDALVNAQIVKPTGQLLVTGHVMVPVVKVLI